MGKNCVQNKYATQELLIGSTREWVDNFQVLSEYYWFMAQKVRAFSSERIAVFADEMAVWVLVLEELKTNCRACLTEMQTRKPFKKSQWKPIKKL